MKNLSVFVLLIIGILFISHSSQTDIKQKLVVGPDKRFLVKENGDAFVWIGETNWFFAKLPPATIDHILDKRSSQGFTIMFVSCREKLYNGEGTGGISSPNEAWWSYLDEYIAKCEQRNLYVGITLGWHGKTRSNSEADLYNYGKWVGKRYKDNKNVIWLTLGEAGSHNRKNTIPDSKLNALIKGIRDGDTGDKLLTVHADFRRGTSLTNDAALCDFNNWQTSQWCCPADLPRKDPRQWTVWQAIEYDYNRTPEKPTLDSEAWYENNKDHCGTTPFNIRRRAYYTILAGAFGHTYGAGGIWDGLTGKNGCSGSYKDALEYPGSYDIGHCSDFFHSLGNDYIKMRPDQNFIIRGQSSSYDMHIQASVAKDSSFAVVYSGDDSKYSLDLTKMKPGSIETRWFDPRNGVYQTDFESPYSNINADQVFDPPGNSGPGNDWVLYLKGTIIRK